MPVVDPLKSDIDPAVREKISALAEEMRRNGGGRDDPVRNVMGLLGDRWSTLVLLVLETGTWRHADLRRMTAKLSAEQAISQRVLTLKLRALEREGFIQRDVTADVPPKVSYTLTPLGLDLIGQVHGLIDWINARREPILTSRAAFDDEHD